MQKRIAKIIIILTAVTLILSSSLLRIPAFEASDPIASALVINSVSALKIDTFDSNGVNNSKSFSLDDIYAMPKTTVYSDLSCYGKLIASGLWGGVSLRVLLTEAGYTEQTANLQFHASDGYTTTLKLSDDTPQDVIVAYELEGSLLPETLRLVIPNANGEAWISMITSISINNPTYPISPNPAAAQIIINQPRLQPPNTLQTSPTPEPKVQPTPQPTVPQTTNQPAQQQNSLSSRIQNGNVYPMIIVAIAAAAATITIGCLFYKRRK